MPKAILAIGVPGSGKTTSLRDLAVREGVEYVSSDETRLAVTGSEADTTRDGEVWPLVYLQIETSLKFDRPVIVDCTSASYVERLKMIEHLRESGAGYVEGRWFDPPLGVSLARNASRKRRVPEWVVRKMHAELLRDPPRIADGFNAIFVWGD